MKVHFWQENWGKTKKNMMGLACKKLSQQAASMRSFIRLSFSSVSCVLYSVTHEIFRVTINSESSHGTLPMGSSQYAINIAKRRKLNMR